MSRANDLRKRIIKLNQFKDNELSLENPSVLYIQDLDDSIKSCMIQLSYVKNNGEGIELMNGWG